MRQTKITIMIDTAIKMRQALTILRDDTIPKRQIITIMVYITLYIKSLKIPNQNPYVEEEQKTQWPKEKVQKDKQRSTKHIQKFKDRVTLQIKY